MSKNRQTVNIKKNSFELAAWNDQRFVIGVDEVGRGCLAGPLVAAAVILPLNKAHSMLKDSKIMTPIERLKAFKWIKKHCWYGIGIVHNRIIDKHNIWQATIIAMKKALIHALEASPHHPTVILVDALPLSLKHTSLHAVPVYNFPFGETKSSSIAAASIVAKVTRDAMMESFDRLIPGYHLTENKGYATVTHRTAIKAHHYSIIHRVSFLDKMLHQESNGESQMSFDDLTMHTGEYEDDKKGEMLCRSD
jgi:ribonuclease HII